MCCFDFTKGEKLPGDQDKPQTNFFTKLLDTPEHVCPLQQLPPPPSCPLSPTRPLAAWDGVPTPFPSSPLFPVTPSPPLPFLSLPPSLFSPANRSRPPSSLLPSPKGAGAGRPGPRQGKGELLSPPPGLPPSSPSKMQQTVFRSSSPTPVKQKSSPISSIAEFPQLPSL
jgi:hypothetical protein